MIYTNDEKYEEYVNSVAAVLNIFNSLTEIEVEIVEKCDSDAGGYTYGDTEEIDIEIATHVMGEPLDEDTILRNIAHELIHAQQIIEERLEDRGLQIVSSGEGESLVKLSVWDGKEYTNTAYDDQPWEIDAYAREEQVMQEALQYV